MMVSMGIEPSRNFICPHFQVLPMTTSFGLIEWVANTKEIGSIINERYKASLEEDKTGGERSSRRGSSGMQVRPLDHA